MEKVAKSLTKAQRETLIDAAADGGMVGISSYRPFSKLNELRLINLSPLGFGSVRATATPSGREVADILRKEAT